MLELFMEINSVFYAVKYPSANANSPLRECGSSLLQTPQAFLQTPQAYSPPPGVSHPKAPWSQDWQ